MRYKTTTKWLAISLCFFTTTAALATSQSAGNSSSYLSYPTVVTLNAGAAWEDAGETQTFFLTPSIQKTYAANRSHQTLANGEFFIGKQKM